MAITNLTNTKWLFKETIDFSLVQDRPTFYINFTSNYVNDYLNTNEAIGISFGGGGPTYIGNYVYALSDEYGAVTSNVIGTDGNWLEPTASTITITGGQDVENPNLIAFLQANAIQVKEPITQLAPFLTNIANAIRTKKGTTETINAQNFASEIESIESGGGFPIYTMTDASGYLIKAAIGIIDTNGVYHEYEADFSNSSSYNIVGSNKMIAFVVSSNINHFESINSVKGLFNLSSGVVATPNNIYAGDILVLTGDAEIQASF